MNMERRQFLKYAAVGLAYLSAGLPGCTLKGRRLLPQQALSDFHLSMTEALVEMVDGTPVYKWVFESPSTGPRYPGPVLNLVEGDPVTIALTNTLDEDHAFAVPGVVDSGPLRPGESRLVSFIAPIAGTYLYIDPLNAPVNRELGLHGAMVVLPRNVGNIPYSNPTPFVRDLFNDLGTTEHFPGEPWNPTRTRIWLFDSVDPKFNQMAMEGKVIDPASFVDEYHPRYFLINGEAGAYAAHNHDTVPSGRIGQPILIRILNADADVHSPHIHGNHVYVTAVNGRPRENAQAVDTFSVFPMDTVDWLLPIIRPPDIPGDPRIPLRDLVRNELAFVLGDVPQSPLTYPMHGHDELSQTGAGGNYPQGLVTTWEITGDVDGVDFPRH
jgi:FtsP/CotA-like multicopper oxidase with cupredoxin domain